VRGKPAEGTDRARKQPGDRAGRSQRTGVRKQTGERTGRAARSEPTGRPERTTGVRKQTGERTGRTERAGRPERTGGLRRETGERTGRAGRTERTGRPERAGGVRNQAGDRRDRTARTDRPERTTGVRKQAGQRSGQRAGAPRRAERAEPAAKAGKQPPKQWGSVARRGAGTLGEDQETASRIWRDAVKRSRDEPGRPRGRDEAWEPEVWREERSAAKAPKSAKAAKAAEDVTPAKRVRSPKPLAAEVADELTTARGERRGTRLQGRLTDAAGAFERGRYLDARRMLKPLADEAPGAASVRELYGLTMYHLGRWRDAARELEAFRSLTGSVEQHPVLADAYRALGRYKKVDQLWEELRVASPSAELVAEGRIVAAGAMADQGDLQGAIALLEKAKLDLKRPRDHTLRLIYALADLYERVGDIPKARDLFRRILARDRDFFDAADRARSLA
jgi:thioredoxin-like negative regulator of GroEL